jgi:hypothetical protein
MENKELLDKIAIIYDADKEKATELLKALYKANEDEFGEGFSITDNPDADMEDDDAAKFLAGQSSKPVEAAPKEKSSFSRRDWKPSDQISDTQKAEIEKHLENGYSEREAHRFAGSHSEEGDFQKAMKSGVNPSMMSDKMIDHVKGLAKQWLDNADRYEKLNADINVNPIKHASGKMLQAHDEHLGDYKKAYNDFLSSDEVKDLKGRDKHNAVKEWKKNYRTENPDHVDKISSVSESQASLSESHKSIKESMKDKMANIISGGFSPDEVHSTSEGAQHAGINLGGEGEKPTGSISKDPLSSFAHKNPKLVSMLSDEQKERFNRVNSAAATQGKQRSVIRRKKDGEQ